MSVSIECQQQKALLLKEFYDQEHFRRTSEVFKQKQYRKIFDCFLIRKRKKIEILKNRKRNIIIQQTSSNSQVTQQTKQQFDQTFLNDFYLTQTHTNNLATANEKNQSQQVFKIDSASKQQIQQSTISPILKIEKAFLIENDIAISLGKQAKSLEREITRSKRRLKQVEQDIITVEQRLSQALHVLNQNSFDLTLSKKTELATSFQLQKIVESNQKVHRSMKNKINYESKAHEKDVLRLAETILFQQKLRKKVEMQKLTLQKLQKEQKILKTQKLSCSRLLQQQSIIRKTKTFMDCKFSGEDKNQKGQSLMEISESLVQYHQRMIKESNELKCIFHTLMDTKKELQLKLKAILSQLQQNDQKQNYKSLVTISLAKETTQFHHQYGYTNKSQRIGQSVLWLIEHLEHLTKRQVKIFKKIVSTWLVNDKPATDFANSIQHKSRKLFGRAPLSLNRFQSRECLCEHFQKWKKYEFFLYFIHSNPFLNSYMDKNILRIHLRRVIKTKMNKKGLSTTEIFNSGLQGLEDDSLFYQLGKFMSTTKLLMQIYSYTNHSHALVINKKQQFASALPDATPSELPICTQQPKKVIREPHLKPKIPTEGINKLTRQQYRQTIQKLKRPKIKGNSERICQKLCSQLCKQVQLLKQIPQI